MCVCVWTCVCGRVCVCACLGRLKRTHMLIFNTLQPPCRVAEREPVEQTSEWRCKIITHAREPRRPPDRLTLPPNILGSFVSRSWSRQNTSAFRQKSGGIFCSFLMTNALDSTSVNNVGMCFFSFFFFLVACAGT